MPTETEIYWAGREARELGQQLGVHVIEYRDRDGGHRRYDFHDLETKVFEDHPVIREPFISIFQVLGYLQAIALVRRGKLVIRPVKNKAKKKARKKAR